ncbi:EAL domain-containing protein [Vibrio sp. Y2-5]|uniref:EAL domain-containing protein n=1 Tax=Vibrio sp. Y2-5 TaxID=2743977 RepID=UPI00166134BA|nr:EAL domain-containing protein [Vibrio sp. Y2-5]MBD0784958.1 EAL domain-containing protein [Vibrio sp. Y2-5]
MNPEKTIKHYIYVFGLIIILLFLLAKYYRDSIGVVDRVSAGISEIVLENIKYYEDEISRTLPIDNCSDFLNKHAKLLLLDRNVRSLNITDHSRIVCSSIAMLNGVNTKIREEKSGNVRLFYVPKTPYSESLEKKSVGAFLLKISYSPTYSTMIALYPESLTEIIDDYDEYDVYVSFENAAIYKNKLVEEKNRLIGSLYKVDFNIMLSSFFKYVMMHHSFSIIFWTVFYFLLLNIKVPFFEKFTIRYWNINKAIKRSEFHPYLQPILDINGTLTGAEVLARWVHPKKGVISPVCFIDEVEANGKITEITRILMKKCSTHLHDVEFMRKGDFYLGFNVCAIQFDSKNLYEDVVRLQNELSSKPIKIVLEITERKEFENEVFISYINRLKDRDIKIALDDFGTGHCSMKYLINSNVDIIKIDRTFVNTISEGPNTHVLDAIINLAKTTEIGILAEGIENQEQFDYLYSKNVTRYQGFYFDKPMPIEEFVKKYFS